MSAATLAMKSSRLATTYPGRNTAASAAASRFALLNVRPASHAALRRLGNEREPAPLLRLPRPFEGCEPPLRHNLRGGERVRPGKERQPVSSGVRGEDVRRGRREDKDAQGGGTSDRRVDQHLQRGRASRWL